MAEAEAEAEGKANGGRGPWERRRHAIRSGCRGLCTYMRMASLAVLLRDKSLHGLSGVGYVCSLDVGTRDRAGCGAREGWEWSVLAV